MAELLLERDALGDVAEVEQDPRRSGDRRRGRARSARTLGRRRCGAQPNAQRPARPRLSAAFSRKRVRGRRRRRGRGPQPAADEVRGVSRGRRARTPPASAPARCRRRRRRHRRSGGRRVSRSSPRRSAARACSATADAAGPGASASRGGKQQQADRQRTEPHRARCAVVRRARCRPAARRGPRWRRRSDAWRARNGLRDRRPARVAPGDEQRLHSLAVGLAEARLDVAVRLRGTRALAGGARSSSAACARAHALRDDGVRLSVFRVARVRQVRESMPAPSVRVRSMSAWAWRAWSASRHA